jgi:hypothetical protein
LYSRTTNFEQWINPHFGSLAARPIPVLDAQFLVLSGLLYLVLIRRAVDTYIDSLPLETHDLDNDSLAQVISSPSGV